MILRRVRFGVISLRRGRKFVLIICRMVPCIPVRLMIMRRLCVRIFGRLLVRHRVCLYRLGGGGVDEW